jgi:uncharacterized protein YvpB
MLKKSLNTFFSLVNQYIHTFQLKKFTGIYSIKPKPPYISQFIGIYPQSINEGDLLTNKKHIKEFGAKDSKEFSFWVWRDCGIACVKMIIDAKGNKDVNKTIMQLTQEGITLGGYILYDKGKFIDKGWFHSALVELLKKNNVNAKQKKWQSIYSVVSDILDNKLVILSVNISGRSHIKKDGSFLPKKNAQYCGHLVLATGVKMNNDKIEGIYVNDPRGLEKYQENTWMSVDTFSTVFSGRTIVAE